MTTEAFDAGKVGQAFSLDGSTRYAQVAAPTGLPVGSSARTISLWFKTPRNLSTQTESALVQYGTASAGQMFGLITSANSPGRLYFYGHSADLAGSTAIQPNRWYHAAVTYDGTTLSLYLDGVLENAADIALNTVLSGDGLTVGYRSAGSMWEGLIDEVSVFSRALTAGEIQEMYNAVRTLSGVTTVTVFTKPYPCPGQCIFSQRCAHAQELSAGRAWRPPRPGA